MDEKASVDESLGSAGLCSDCLHARRVTTAKGSLFLLCKRSMFDPIYLKYPRLPVIECEGYEEVPPLH